MAVEYQSGRFNLKHRGRNQNLEEYERMIKEQRRDKAVKKYLRSPDNWYNYLPNTSIGYYERQGAFTRALNVPYLDRDSDYWKYQPLYPRRYKRNRKALIIGERPSLWKSGSLDRPELPGNLFIDNLKYKNIDWSTYKNVTWNQVLESHRKDVERNRKNILTLPQKEAWLSSIYSRYDFHKDYRARNLPHISPRLFKPKSMPRRPQPIKYRAQDGMGTLYYLEGSSDVTNKQYRKLVFPEVTRRAKTPKKLNF